LIFALFPTLKELSLATPLEVIRPPELSAAPKNRGRFFPLALLALLVGVISTDRPVFGSLAALGVGATLLLLFGTAWVLRSSARAMRPAWWPFSLRYALSNLDRPGNQTSLLIVAFGVTTMLLGLIVICYHALHSQTELARSGVRSTAFLIDVQPDQVEGVKSILQELQAPIQQEASITLMRLHRIGDRTVSELLTDGTHDIPDWTLHREFWSTARADLRESEEIIEGEWVPRMIEGSDTLPVSIERKFMRRLGLSLGDLVEFDIGGTIVTSRITSVRDIRWERMERNSFLVFPEGSLSFAPSFNVYGVSTGGPAETAQLMSRLGQEFPNVSIFDVRSAVDTIERVLGYMLSVLYGLVLVVLGAAVVTLIGVIALGRGERIREHALLRTVGASHRFLRRTLQNEYALLGSAAALMGILASIFVGALITHYGFRVPLVLPVLPLVAILLSAPLAVLGVVELFGRIHRSISPAEALRAE
jgi:putative ABC transport system permease protein